MSTGFTFGPNTTTPAFGQTSFGAQPAQPSGSITFGTPVSSAVGNTGFGQPSTGFGQTNFSGFGAQPTQSTPLSNLIGTTTGLSTFNVGNPTASTGFGISSQTGLMAAPTAVGFGVPQPAATQTGFGFSAPQQQQQQTTSVSNISGGFGLGLTAPTATTASFRLSNPQTTSTNLGFAATSTGFNFNAPGVTTQPTFKLGATSAPSTGLSFAAPTTASTGLNLGGISTTTTGGGLFQSQPQTSIGGFFSTPTTSAGLSLGTTLTTPSLGLSFAATTAPTLSFSAPATTTTATIGLGGSGFNLGGSFGLGGSTATPSLTKPTTTTTQSVGLGGIVTSTPKAGSTTSKGAEVLPKNEPLPNEIQQTVESFKSFVKQQKAYSSDVARCSVKEFKKVSDEIEMVSNLLNEVEKQLQTNRAVSEKLKLDTAKGLQCVELAQRTLDTPPGLQYENTAPMEFFVNLIAGFENEMHTLQMQIENTDRYVKNLGKPSVLSSEDLAMGLRRLHESFVALAGRLQSVHTQVQSQKEQYLNLRKYMLHDDTNIFEKNNSKSETLNISLNDITYKPSAVASGPSPFSTLTHPSIVQANLNQTHQQQSGVLNPQTQQQSLFGSTQPVGNIFGNTSLNSSIQPMFGANTSAFQLQKPPTGNKRSK
ncbi:nuclear pore complex protein Nup58 [Onthophagus taurus]|uniref:nuclear pore complex protein Nup58 n=1 Tax=Onthophagus taurus TaxID=166361 RepID=UPI0039BE024F